MSIKTIANIGLCLVPVAYKLLEKYLEKKSEANETEGNLKKKR